MENEVFQKRVAANSNVASLVKLPSDAITNPSQATVSMDRSEYVSLLGGVSSLTIFAGAQQTMNVVIRKNEIQLLQKVTMRLNITNDSDCYLLQTPYWIDHIDVRARNGSGDLIQ